MPHDDSGALRIDVTDSGPGIPKTNANAFSTCSTASSAATRGREGTGLGLTICQGMIGAHGGSVEALPGADGRGTTIRITLPRIEPLADYPEPEPMQ